MEGGPREMLFKIILIGDSSTGKTNILSQYLYKKFESNTKATIGVEFGGKSFVINGDNVKAQIWDTAGQERYKSITSAYYKGAQGAFIVYDITRLKTFDNVDKWINDLKANTSEEISILLLGNKSDLQENREVSKEQGESKAQQFDIGFLETSALNGDNIDTAFQKLVNEVYNKCSKVFDSVADVEIEKGQTIDSSAAVPQKKGCC